MRKTRRLVFWALLSNGVFGQSGITGSCRNGGTYPNCVGGEVVFTGSGYPAQVHITVSNSAGTVIDDGDYTTNGGILSFTENLSFADTYTISVNRRAIVTVTTQ
jgi:hypothetical protein